MSFIDFSVIDAIDILVVGILIWQVYRAIRGTTAIAIFTGVFALYLLWIIVRTLGMELLSSILGQIIGIGALALLIVFQQEVRRYLLMIGNRYTTTRKGFFRRLFAGQKSDIARPYIGEIAAAAFEMSRQKIGALIAIEKTGDLDTFASTGDIINADTSSRLIQSIFYGKSPLHDGAVIIKDERIWGARCTLPISDNPYIPAHLGMRHRAAIGLTEQTDAIMVVVSEETGTISFVEGGNIKIVSSEEKLLKLLADLHQDVTTE